MIKCEKDRKEISNVTEDGQTFYDLGNVHVFNIGISCIHGEELLRQLAFHQEYKRSHTQAKVRHIYEIGV